MISILDIGGGNYGCANIGLAVRLDQMVWRVIRGGSS
jgi:hypothetical protein